jgi:hypothetical protein
MLPKQNPFEIVDEIIKYAGLQLGLNATLMNDYITNSKKISDHQNKILKYLDFNSFDQNLSSRLATYVFEQAFQYEQLSLLLLKGNQFLRKNKSLIPTGNKFTELVRSQRRLAREAIFDLILSKLSADIITNIEHLLKPNPKFSKLEHLKRVSKNASAETIKSLIAKLRIIENTGILEVDIKNVNQNYQRALASEVKRCSASRLRELDISYRYSSLTAYLQLCYTETIDFIIKTFIGLLNTSYTKSDNRITKIFKEHKDSIRECKYSKSGGKPLNLETTQAGIRVSNI